MAVIFSSCGFFLLSFFFFFLFSSHNLSGRRLPYFYTWCGPSANLDGGLKCAAGGSLEMQDAKKSPKTRHLRTIAQLVAPYLRN